MFVGGGCHLFSNKVTFETVPLWLHAAQWDQFVGRCIIRLNHVLMHELERLSRLTIVHDGSLVCKFSFVSQLVCGAVSMLLLFSVLPQ